MNTAVDTSDPEKQVLQKLIQKITIIPGEKRCNKSQIYRRQWLTSIYFSLPLVVSGMAIGHSSILMEELKPSTLNITQSMKIENGDVFGKPTIFVESLNSRSWIVSVLMLSTCPGCWVFAIFSQLLGRKSFLIISMGLNFLALSMQAFAENSSQILIGRILLGFSIGISAEVTALYQGECALPKLRATLNLIQNTAFALGIGISHALGVWFYWRVNVLFTGLVSIITLILCCGMVESPMWLLKKKKFRAAVKSWTYWRGTEHFEEFKSMHSEKSISIYEENNEKKLGSNKFFRPSFLKPLGIVMIFWTVTEFSGLAPLTHYSLQMVSAVSESDSVYIPVLILDTLRCVSMLTSGIFIKRYGPRSVALWSSVTTSILLILLSLVMLLNLQNSGLALSLLFGYEIAVMSGLKGLPWLYSVELFPTSCNELGIGISTSYNFILSFLILKLNPCMALKFQAWGVFVFYGLCTSFGSVFLYLILPDTRNKSFKEIELMFSSD